MQDVSAPADIRDGVLRLSGPDGAPVELHPLWLRERCPCADCRDPGTGQRLLDSWSLPVDTAIRAVEADGDRLTITFADGHVGPFTLSGLRAAVARPADERDDIQLWDASLRSFPEADWRRAGTDDAGLYDLLEQLRRFGFVLVRNVPTETDAVGEVVARIGPMRRTNWGGIADVKAVASAYDLTMTSRGLEQHTDNPYREPVPGYIFLHCLVNDADGGDSTVTDGFRVAEELRRTAPEEFDALTRVRPTFTYVDSETILENAGPLIELDPRGRVRQLRLSNRTEAAPADDPALLDLYYRARQRFGRLVNDPRFQLQFKLEPGDLMIMDNYRLLHGRTGYALGTGHRHMRQCYMDRDSVGSRRKMLARTHAG